MKWLCLALIRGYKRVLSPHIGQDCKYTPTCSMYTYDAIKKHGVIIGCTLGAWRILRCNPFSKGGFDPVPENYKGKVKWLV
ncbi:MAG: membrane protein insertion efficiency factor YidD [Clostridia bacterium]|nr:membrane protein insertion efficiency factor YidD [Clostridia bacterium]